MLYKGTYAGDTPILEVFEETIKKENGDYKRNSLFGREIFFYLVQKIGLKEISFIKRFSW